MMLALRIFIALILTVTSVTTVNAAFTGDCKTCHSGEYDAWDTSPHFTKTVISNKPSVESCFRCHGASTSHLYSR